MFDEKFIEEFMPSLMTLVKKYANEEHDEDELLSDGQWSMLEYLRSHKDDNKNLKKNLYASLENKLRKISEKHEEEKVSFDSIQFVTVKTIDPEKFIERIKECLNNKEFKILTDYYGVFTNSKTLKEIAKESNASEEHIRWTIKYAENKIRKSFKNCGISFEDLF